MRHTSTQSKGGIKLRAHRGIVAVACVQALVDRHVIVMAWVAGYVAATRAASAFVTLVAPTGRLARLRWLHEPSAKGTGAHAPSRLEEK